MLAQGAQMSTGININDLFNHMDNLVNKVVSNWNFFAIVSLGIIGALATTSPMVNEIFGSILLAGAILFFVSNYISLNSWIKELKVTENQITSKLKNDNAGLDKEFVEFYVNGHEHFNRF
jgi:hypothetical protein